MVPLTKDQPVIGEMLQLNTAAPPLELLVKFATKEAQLSGPAIFVSKSTIGASTTVMVSESVNKPQA